MMGDPISDRSRIFPMRSDYSAESNSGPGRTIDLPIEGMHCASCVGRVERALRAVDGVQEAGVNLATGRATLRLGGSVDGGTLVGAVEAAGFAIPETTSLLAVSDMTCASCVTRVERALAAVPGVRSATVNLATGRATIVHAAGLVTAAALAEALGAAGYGIVGEATATTERGDEAEGARLRRDTWIAAVLAAPLLVIEMGSHLVPGLHAAVTAATGQRSLWVLEAVLATLALFGPGLRFLRAGGPALLRGHPDMNSLVALGTSSAYVFSLLVVLAPGDRARRVRQRLFRGRRPDRTADSAGPIARSRRAAADGRGHPPADGPRS